MKHLLLILAFLAPIAAQGQTGSVTGRIVDEKGRPLPGANVVVIGTTIGSAADADGSYRITRVPEGRQTLRASVIGFRASSRDVTVQAGGEIRVDFSLSPVVLDGDEVVVTASRRVQAAADVPASVAVLSPRDLERRNVVSLDDALRYIPGVHVQENQVNVRGSSGFAYNTGSRVLLLLDGVPILTPDSDGMPFDALPFAQVERIEVIKGPGSALYGSGALGGVVNVLTRRPPETPETTIQAWAGLREPARYQVWRDAWEGGDRPRAFSGLTLGHARRFGANSGGWLHLNLRRDEGYLNFSDSWMIQGFGKLDFRPTSSFRGDVLVGLLARKRDNFIFWNGGRDALNPGRLEVANPDGPPSGTNDVFTNQISLLPSITHFVQDNLFYAVRLRLFGSLIRPIDNETGAVKSFDEGTVGFRYGGEIQVNYEPKPGTHITAGAAGDALATRSSFFSTAGDGDEMSSQPEGALFGQIETGLGSRLAVTGGLRFDHYRIDAADAVQRLSPKASLVFTLSDAASVRLAYGHGFRVPSLAERYTDNRDFFPIVRNLKLRPEHSTSIEAGLRFQTRAEALGRVQSDVAVFWNDYWDLIEPRLVPELRAFQFVNLTRARIRGAEASLDYRLPGDEATFRLGYTYLVADDLDLDEPLAFRAAHQLTTGFDVRPWGPLELGLDFRYLSEPDRVDSDFARFVQDADRLVAVQVVDVRIAVATDRYRVALLVNNVFDYYYLERPAYLGPPRYFTLRTQLDF